MNAAMPAMMKTAVVDNYTARNHRVVMWYDQVMDESSIANDAGIRRRIPPSVGDGAALALRKCSICNEDFLVPASLAANYSCCSKVCSRKRRERGRGGHVDTTCQICDVPIRVFKSNVFASNYCSNRCRMIGLNAIPRSIKDRSERARALTRKGYIRISTAHGQAVLEHRAVMAEAVGRLLDRAERVHHINGVRTDNVLGNLVLFASQTDHMLAMHPELAENLGRREPPSISEHAVRRRQSRSSKRDNITPVFIPDDARNNLRRAIECDDRIPRHYIADWSL